ncbi:hypothetical protein MSG28_014485 [Choristoneura fumiferana]|uniref:Uncharacterized protein n=1 Tax=Choristoneura fumiferana TaxID=7141 RepID=A0ACC0JRL8_CHOFU|nr:hypothetical protein MSG28_014485 [Choristoneura fumiferana]
MLLLVLLAASAAALPQLSEKELLVQIFGTPPPFPVPTTQGLEDYTVRSTDSSLIITDDSGATCKCVPYYLCDASDGVPDGVNANNVSVTGWGIIDVRFGADSCMESTEVCCKSPKTEPTQTLRPNVPRPAGCGFRNRQGVDFNIVGAADLPIRRQGAEAQFGEFPWVVAILNETNGYLGVGSLIHPQVVITAAHILYKYRPGSLKIHAGEWDTQTTKERLPYQERSVSEYYLHSGFKNNSLHNDMALLRLSVPVTLDEHIGLLCLPDQGENFESGRECVANGWGKNLFGAPGRYAVILKRIVLNMVPHWLCDQLLKQTRLGPRFRLHDSFVCAGGEAGKDTCQGDGGAPLACPVGGDRYKLTGLVAWGIGCGEPNVPAAYTAVARFRQWVDDKMEEWGYGSDTYTV